jgi:tetratricopeptide (TPR) repeat protein
MSDTDLVRKTKIEIFRAVLKLDPKAPVVGELAEALHDDGQFEEAVEACREGITFHPDLLICRAIMAESLEALGRRDEAVTVIESTRDKAAQAKNGLHRLARLEERLTTGEVLGEAVRETSEEPPPVDLPSSTLAELYLRQGDRDAAVQVYQRMLDQDPDDPVTRDRLDAILGKVEALPDESGGKRKLLQALERWLDASRLRAAGSFT